MGSDPTDPDIETVTTGVTVLNATSMIATWYVPDFGDTENDNNLERIIGNIRHGGGGTHVRATGEIGLFRLVSENAVSPEFTKRIQAGKVIQHIAPLLGGRGGGKDISQLNATLEAARTLISGAS